MNLKLPVEVHLSVSPQGAFVLHVGGLPVPILAVDLGRVMRNGDVPPLKPVASVRMCRWGDAKAVPGKKLCQKHIAIAVRSAAGARAAKKRAASQAKLILVKK